MSILIKNMKMPKRCGGCFLRVGECKQRIYMEDRPHDCPLVPIPPHGRLIDADELLTHARPIENFPSKTEVVVYGVIEGSPTIIESEE